MEPPAPFPAPPSRARPARAPTLLAALLVLLAGCGESDGLVRPAEPATVSIWPAALSLPTGATAQLQVVVSDASGKPLWNHPVQWSSTDTAVVTIDSRGGVRGGRRGKAQVVASVQGSSVSARADVDVVVVCPAIAFPAIAVEVRDSSTGAPAALNAIGVLRDGAYTDTMRIGDWLTPDPATAYRLIGAMSRAGTYDVEIRKAGYRTWTASGVRVEPDECQVRTVVLKAALVRQP